MRFHSGLGPRSFNLKPNSSRGWNAGSHRSGRIARRVARLVVVCYPPTLASPVPSTTPFSALVRLLPSSDSKTSPPPPIYGQLSPPMQLLSIWSTSSVTSGWNRNYARSNGGQLGRIILARINRLDRGLPWLPSCRAFYSATSKIYSKRRRFSNKPHATLVHKKDTKRASEDTPVVTY